MGGLAFVVLIALGTLVLRRRQRRASLRVGGDGRPVMAEDPHRPTPFTLFRRPLLMHAADRSTETDSATKSVSPVVHISSPAVGTDNTASGSRASPGGAATSPGGERLSPAAGSPRTGIATRASGEMVMLPRSDVLGMQAEMEVLREEMRQIIEERQEPPPEYTSTFGS